MITGIDHAVLLGTALAPAVRGFEDAGFVVIPGGVHPAWGTENALIPMADGFYLELLAPRDPAPALRHRLQRQVDGTPRAAGEYAGYALESSALQADVQSALTSGLEFQPPVMGARRRPDGFEVRWRSATSPRPDFPFLIEDLTPRSERVPPPGGGLNARTRLASVTVAVDDVDEASQAYAALLGQPAVLGPAGEGILATQRGSIALIRKGAPAHSPGVVTIRLVVSGWTGPSRLDAAGGAGVILTGGT